MESSQTTKIKLNTVLLLILIFVVIILRQFSLLDAFENFWLDNLFPIRYFFSGKERREKSMKKGSSPIVIVAVPSFEELQRKYRKPEDLKAAYARTIDLLTKNNAKVIALNFLPTLSRAEMKGQPGPGVKKDKNSIVIPLILIRMGKSLSLIGVPEAQMRKGAGAIGFTEVSSNVKMRWLPMEETLNLTSYRHFVLQILTKYYGLKEDEVLIKNSILGTTIKFGNVRKFTLQKRNRYYINYFSTSIQGISSRAADYFSIYRIEQILNKEIDPKEIQGKIVILGSVDPVERYFQLTPLGFVSDSEIYAQALYAILKGPELRLLPDILHHLIIVLLGYGSFVLFSRVRVKGNPLKGNYWVFLAVVAVFLLINVLLFCTLSIYVDIAPFTILLAGVFFLSLHTTSEEQQLELDQHIEKFKMVIERALEGSESTDWGSSMLTLICNPFSVDRGVLILIRDDKIGPEAREFYCYPLVENARSTLYDEEIEAMLRIKKPMLGPSSLVVPLTKGSERFGFLKLQKRSFTSQEIQTMMALAHLTFISLYNVRLMEKIRKSERLEIEAEMAGQIQKAFLVDKPPEVKGVSLACRCIPASEAGGDYFDFITFQEGFIGIAVADVTGHGMGAAIITGLLRSGLRAQSALSTSPADVVTSINNVLYNDFLAFGKMASLYYATYSVIDKTLTFTNAGQSPPLLIRREEPKARQLKGKGPILGFRSNIKYKEFRVKVYPGDIIVFMTDGIVESENTSKEFFGQERIEQLVRDNMEKPAQEILDIIFDEVEEFIEGREQKDDNTLIVMKA